MLSLLIAILLTCGVSFICSLWEAMILSTTVGEIESLKNLRPKRGVVLERLKTRLEDTSSAILTLNTIANTLGSVIVGGLATKLFGNAVLGVVSAGMTVGILIFSEVIPKNLGVIHRRKLQPAMVYPLAFVVKALRPVTWLCGYLVRLLVGTAPDDAGAGEEIRLLAERGARHGTLSVSESSIITNALRLDEVRVSAIMTPRNVVTGVRQSATIGEVFQEFPNVSFGRMPVYGRNLDDIVGIVRRRDLLKAKANDQDADPVGKFVQEAHFVPETVTAAEALRLFLEYHQRLLVVVDEYGSTAGVISMEDVMETLLGREIFEKDDVAVDMRELARVRVALAPSKARPAYSPAPSPTATPPSTSSSTS
ncbi:MAG: hemolysin family protein [Opitutaceae bacterium]|jgi:CBS domain containing-hemolysin-like protein|nr:hemolysin family protein [Opitutaceae bacterium]